MQITLTSRKKHKPSFHFNAGKGFLFSIALFQAFLVGGSIYAGYEISNLLDSPEKKAYREEIARLNDDVRDAKREINNIDFHIEKSLGSILNELGSIKGEMIAISARQDARATHSGFDSDDFSEIKERLATEIVEFKDSNNILDFWETEKQGLNDFLGHIKVRESILDAQESSDDQSEAYHFIDRPVADPKSWLSSNYGYRSDPFSGRRAWHDGVDFAGREGSGVLAASSGIVTFAGDRYGYGNLVEISHSDGVVTRYGHAKEILVEKGDQVSSGDLIAKMGNTGRSTGPHLHFEVIHDGKSKNPLNYLGNPIKMPD